MAIFNLGSINIDHFYTLPHLPQPGETLSATSHSFGLGGKGINQSVAAARAGAKVHHVGAISKSDTWVRDRIESYGVNCQHISALEADTGHAIILVDSAGENSIILDAGANAKIHIGTARRALDAGVSHDIFLIQNETNLQVDAAKLAKAKGMRVFYSAAPFDLVSVQKILPYVSTLLVNEVEAEQICAALGSRLDEIPVPQILVTLGSKGAMWRSNETGEVIEVSSPKVTAVDTTAAGDTFAGYFAAGCDLGLSVGDALLWAASAASLKVTQHGTADAIPTAKDVAAFQSK